MKNQIKKHLTLLLLILFSLGFTGFTGFTGDLVRDVSPAIAKAATKTAAKKEKETVSLTDKMKDKKTLSNLEVENGKKGVVITWGHYKGAEKYKVCRKVDSGKYEVLATKSSQGERKYVDKSVKEKNISML